jgi:hypothetical protein
MPKPTGLVLSLQVFYINDNDYQDYFLSLKRHSSEVDEDLPDGYTYKWVPNATNMGYSKMIMVFIIFMA